ncbi:MAG: 16S rRNA (adenine(1518)-N(6)/adenine(1519)-N(6))-dimethyltransferase RsmA [Thermoleophilia bacterium]
MSAPRLRPTALRRFGQNHLVDKNTLAAIVRVAGVQADDVVLEVGAATGVLTEQLLIHAASVHMFEIDRRFAPSLERLAVSHPNLQLHWGDAVRADLASLDPSPTALVANLAYNIAIPLIMTSLVTLPSLQRWAVMVQRELGERLFAVPSTKAYSAVSVLVQLACVREAVRPVARTVFSPQPNVDSQFVVFTRRRADGIAPAPGHTTAPGLTVTELMRLDRLVRFAFGQRRKMLVNSLTGAAYGGRALTRDDVQDALRALGLSLRVRPEELAPDVFVTLARELQWL